MPRFSILRLMALVLFIAIGLAAAMAGAFTFAVVALLGATVGSFLSTGRGRAFFLGCTVVGWASMFLAFGVPGATGYHLPTAYPIIRVYEAIHGPGPATFASPEDASVYVAQLIDDVNRAITVGHSLISLALALAGGAVLWLVANRRKGQMHEFLGSLQR
ncbi:MAG TPA: hypothetical protein VGH33_16320 [Isosphaeraceae bacterium]